MGESMTLKQNTRLGQKLVYDNIMRVLLVSVVCAILLPVLIYISKSATGDLTGVLRGALKAFEVISLVFAGLSYASLRSRDSGFMKLVYRSFWGLFMGFSFLIVYSDMSGGSGLLYYATMLAVFALVPLMSLFEQVYYLVVESLFIGFLSAKFGVNSKLIFDLVLINAVFFAMSRFAYKKSCEEFRLREKLKDMKESTLQDGLTGLQNRKSFDSKVNTAVRECIQNRRRLSVIMIDIDDMKKYNSEFGSDRGDQMIRTVAELVRAVSARNTDMVCRIEGGRFVICMEGGDDMTPVQLADKIRTTVERKGIRQARNATNSYVSVSVGVASTIPRSEIEYSELCEEAEDAMFAAKEHGKNIVVYDEQIYGRDAFRRAAY